jgi:uncharacterized membrane protein
MFLRSSLVIAPILSMLAAVVAGPLVRMVDAHTRWTLLGYGPDGARAVVGALSGSLLTFIVFAFSLMLIAAQVAGGQLSPRIVARIFETRFIKLVLSAFIFSFCYSLAALGRIDDRVPQLPLLIVVVSSLLSVVLFLEVIQEANKNFRPVIILTQVAADTRKVIAAVYPNPLSIRQGAHLGPEIALPPPARTIVHVGRSGSVITLDRAGLLEIATRAGCIIELVPQVGDFLAVGEDAFRLFGAGADTVDDAVLRRCIALGPERELDKDPAFGFRILVDISIKALSPAINDPTTGELAVDQIQHLLHLLGQRQLDSGVVRGSSGEVRVLYRTPCWEDFVTLAVTEIRLCGAGSPQVTRRLQAMFDQLVQVLPAERCAALRKEMALLERTIARTFPDPEDRILAKTGDLQGFGSREQLNNQKTKETEL